MEIGLLMRRQLEVFLTCVIITALACGHSGGSGVNAVFEAGPCGIKIANFAGRWGNVDCGEGEASIDGGKKMRLNDKSRIELTAGEHTIDIFSVPSGRKLKFTAVSGHSYRILRFIAFDKSIVNFYIEDKTDNILIIADVRRATSLAGQWYPGDKKELTSQIKGFIQQADVPRVNGRILGLISPHAGYVYSGRTTGAGFKAVEGDAYKTVVLIGFTHHEPAEGICVYNAGAIETVLGEIAVDSEIANKIVKGIKTRLTWPDLFFNKENSVETIIPFIQVALNGARIVPVIIGQDYKYCEELANSLAGAIKDRNDVLVIASSDMSHFHTYEDAGKLDSFVIDDIKKFDPQELYVNVMMRKGELCGVAPVTALLMTMKALGAGNVEILKHENSADVTGNRDNIVGYMSAVFYKSNSGAGHAAIAEKEEKKKERDMLDSGQRKRLLQIARESIASFVRDGRRKDFKEDDPVLNKEMGAFVTLREGGSLRGCIGNMVGRLPLYRTVAAMAVEAATGDPRFPPLSDREIDKIDIEISVLSPMMKVAGHEDVNIPGDGVLIRKGFASGVYLPQVAAETGWNKEEFLTSLCAHKAGLASNAWKDPDTEIYTFQAEVFQEKGEKI